MPVAIIVILRGGSLGSLVKIRVHPILTLILAAVGVLVIALIWFVKAWRQKIVTYATRTYHDFQELASSPKELGMTAVFSLGITVAYVASLYFSLRAVGLSVSPLATLVIYASATIAGSVSPAPGGLGTLEVAMIATLIGFGFAQPQAYAAVILYRLSTFWAPVPFGFLAYQYIQKKNIV